MGPVPVVLDLLPAHPGVGTGRIPHQAGSGDLGKEGPEHHLEQGGQENLLSLLPFTG